MRVYRVYMNSQLGFRSTLLLLLAKASTSPPPPRALPLPPPQSVWFTNEKIINDFVNNLSHFIEVFIPWPPTVNTQLIWWLFDCFFFLSPHICLCSQQTARNKGRTFDKKNSICIKNVFSTKFVDNITRDINSYFFGISGLLETLLCFFVLSNLCDQPMLCIWILKETETESHQTSEFWINHCGEISFINDDSVDQCNRKHYELSFTFMQPVAAAAHIAYFQRLSSKGKWIRIIHSWRMNVIRAALWLIDFINSSIFSGNIDMITHCLIVICTLRRIASIIFGGSRAMNW